MLHFDVQVKFARRMPDPVLSGCERHIFLCSVLDVPPGLPKDPNPREQNIDRGIWREIEKHLFNQLGTPNTFHLKNKGITILAKSVQRTEEDGDIYRLSFDKGHGVVDGGHTYTLICENRDRLRDMAGTEDSDGINQFVKLEVFTGVSDGLVPEIAGGLNTAVQVQEMSLQNLKGAFDWLKDELQAAPYVDQIAWRENDPGEFDARDLVVLMELFNVAAYPNDKPEQPVRAYSSKSVVLEQFVRHPSHYKLLAPILRDILTLHDIIGIEARELHNERGGRAGGLAFVESRKRGEYKFVFTNQTSPYRLSLGALFPMLAAFRWCVEISPETQRAQWRGGFERVKQIWSSAGAEMMRITKELSDEQGRNPNAIGKSRNHWGNLHRVVAHYERL